MTPQVKKILMFLIFFIGAGIIYPLIMSGIFKLAVKTSIVIGMLMGLMGGVLWVVTANQKEKRNAANEQASEGAPQ